MIRTIILGRAQTIYRQERRSEILSAEIQNAVEYFLNDCDEGAVDVLLFDYAIVQNDRPRKLTYPNRFSPTEK